MCLVFNGRLYLRDNVLESHGLICVGEKEEGIDTPLGRRHASLVRYMYPAVKACESVQRCTTLAVRPGKVRYLQKTHGF